VTPISHPFIPAFFFFFSPAKKKKEEKGTALHKLKSDRQPDVY
jgi:hypothetical protein